MPKKTKVKRQAIKKVQQREKKSLQLIGLKGSPKSKAYKLISNKTAVEKILKANRGKVLEISKLFKELGFTEENSSGNLSYIGTTTRANLVNTFINLKTSQFIPKVGNRLFKAIDLRK